MTKKNLSAILLAFSLVLFTAGCKKKAPPPPPPPPPAPVEKPAPPPAKPAIQFSAEPATIERGQSARLNWTVSDANDVTISPGIGTVDARGSRQVSPADTTTYTMTAKGPGGAESATATVTVTVPPPPPPPPPPAPKLSLSELVSSQLRDAYFDYDKSDLREDARAVLTQNADALRKILADFNEAAITIEGNCDERGSAEYNLGLGDRRATAAKEFLVQLGVGGDKLKTISYGKERPICTEHDEECWQKNRRDHFSAGQQ
jgi:peptidoglycan-associated lipoprotein